MSKWTRQNPIMIMEIVFDFLQSVTILLFIISSTRSSAIHREHEFLISKENSQYYGIFPSKDEYAIIHLNKSSLIRTRREAVFKDRPTEVSFKAFGEDYRLHVRENSVLIPQGLRAEYVNENGKVIKEKEIPRGCHYVGSVVSHEADGNALSAISLCSGISGLISTRKHILYIKPLRKDHSREYMNKLGHNNRLYHPHLVYRRSAADQHSDPDYFCGLDPVHFHLTNKSIMSPPNTTPPSTPSGDKSTRKRRQTSAKYLEVMVTIDRDMADVHGESVDEYAIDLLNVAAARFQDESLGTIQLFFYIVGVRVLSSDTVNVQGTTLQFNSSGEYTLTNFCKYQSALNPTSDSDPGHWDVAILLTRKDLELNGSSRLLGIANQGKCEPSGQCLLCEDYGLSAGLILSHEIGHTVGMTHDGGLDAQSCRNGEHIMSSSRINGAGTFQWSPCSRSNFQSFIRQYACLNDIPAGQLIQLSENLGFKKNSNEQCRLYSASMPLACSETQLRQIGNLTLADTCGILYCVENEVCKPTPLPSLDGTVCGVDMVCKEGSCQSGITSGDSSNDPIRPQTPINGGWSEWLPNLTPCTRTCGGGIQLQYRFCTNPVPANGGTTCVGRNSRPRLCNDQPCLTSQLDFKNEQCEMQSGIGSSALITQGNDEVLCQMKCFNHIQQTTNSHGFYVDGTHCGDDYSVCVNGQCERFGCDGIQDSNLVNDRCGVCGGNGLSCFKVGYYDRGYIGGVVNVLTFARGTTDIYVKSTNPTTSIGLKVGENYIIDGQSLPDGTVRNFDYLGNSVLYKTNVSVETINISGPTSQLFTLTVYVSDGLFTNLADYTPAVLYQYFGEPVTLLNNYKWLVEEGTCVTCATFVQNVVTCVWLEENVIVHDLFCNNEPLPCCTYTWFYQSYQPCNATCGTDSYRTRTSVCVSELTPQNPVDSSLCSQPPHLHERCNVPACPTYEWLLQEWGQCSVTCGVGVQGRTVICHEATSALPVSDSFCNQPRPITQRLCFSTCPCQPISCVLDSLFNTVTCSCQECEQLNCASGFIYNRSTCQCEACEPIPCTPGNLFNHGTCSCQACPILSCEAGQRYDASLCSCEAVCEEQPCNFGSSFKFDTCQCESNLSCGEFVQGNSTAKEGSLVQFDPVKGQVCSIILVSPVGYVIELTFVVVFVDGQKNEMFEVTDGLQEYTSSSLVYNETWQYKSNFFVINLLVTENGHGYFITYKLLEDSGT